MSSRGRQKHPVRRVATACAAVVALLAAATVGGTGSASAAPEHPTPAAHVPVVDGKKVDPKLGRKIADVNARLAQLARQNDGLDERYNVAVATEAARQQAARRAQLAAQRATAEYRTAHRQFIEAMTQRYEYGTDPTVGALLTSDTPQRLLDGVEVAGLLSSQFATIMSTDRSARSHAAAAAQRARTALAAARAEAAALARQRAVLEQQQKKFQQLLDSLSARQRREIAHARAVAAAKARAELLAQEQAAAAAAGVAAPAALGAPGAFLPGNVSATVQKVIAYAEAQVGKPYVFGAAGPTAYDCSGLTMQAWAQAGFALPHSAAGQYAYGTHVPWGQLKPGDLIFLYSPIEHVELYVGNDLAVSAADPALGIIYVRPSQDLGDFAGATRLAG